MTITHDAATQSSTWTTTYGTGSYTFSMPLSLASQFPMVCLGFGNGTAYREGMSLANGSGLYSIVSNTWANGDFLSPIAFGGWIT